MAQRLAGGTKSGCVGHGSTKYTYQHGKVFGIEQGQPQNEHHHDVEQYHTCGNEVHCHASLLERREERGAYLKSDAENKEYEPEILDKVHDFAVACETEMPQ